jgi:hypothetical protein
MEQIQSVSFDSYTDTASTAKDSTRFAKPHLFGIETSDSCVKGDWKNYDDIDDFHGDTLSIKPGFMNEEYKAYIQVYYVNVYGDINQKFNQSTDKQRYVKRIDVKVWRSFPPIDTQEAIFDTINISDLHGYYFFNP